MAVASAAITRCALRAHERRYPGWPQFTGRRLAETPERCFDPTASPGLIGETAASRTDAFIANDRPVLLRNLGHFAPQRTDKRKREGVEWLENADNGRPCSRATDLAPPYRRAAARCRLSNGGSHGKPPREKVLLCWCGCPRTCPRACGGANGIAGPRGCAGTHGPGADVRGRSALAEAAAESLAAGGDYRRVGGRSGQCLD